MSEGSMKASANLSVAAGEREKHAALDTFFRTYFHELVGMLRRRVRDPELARDLAQTAFERLAERVDAPHLLEEPRGYLMMIAQNAHIDHVRRERVGRNCERQAQTGLAVNGVDTRTPEEVALQRERLAALEAIIRALPPMRRRIFILSRLHGLSADEIAEQEGMSRRAVRSHIERALADIRAEMGDTRPRRPSQRGGR